MIAIIIQPYTRLIMLAFCWLVFEFVVEASPVVDVEFDGRGLVPEVLVLGAP